MREKQKVCKRNLNPARGASTRLMAAVFAMIGSATGVVSPQVMSAEVEEIVVTAQRRAQSIQDIPYNISAYGDDDLQSARAFDIGDVARLVPGLYF